MLHKFAICWVTAFALVLSTSVDSRAASPPVRVEMEVLTEPGLNASSASQRWIKLLGDCGFSNVQFRGAQPGDKIKVEAQGSGPTASIAVTAQLDGHGSLVTPGGTFTLADGMKLKKWVTDLQAGGVENVGQPRTSMGFTPTQLTYARRELSTPVAFSTKGMAAPEAADKIAGALKVKMTIDPAISKALAEDDPVRDELKGVASGTALAAIARPAGGVLLPKFVGGAVQLQLTKAQPGAEGWHVGWPPAEKDEGKIIPALFDFIPVEIEDTTPASKALDAIQARLKVPFLYDHNAIAQEQVDLSKTVKMAATKTFYHKILDQILFQVRLKMEVRLDDAGKPFLWITTLQPH